MAVIYGAGLAGLIAGCMFQTAKIFEAGSEGQINHKAVLRFRSSAVGDAVGVDFRKVRVNKGIWHDGEFVKPDIRLSNFYSKKVIGRFADRSIWNIDAVDRFIAPEDFICQLAERCARRIEWNHLVTSFEIEKEKEDIISTIPMSLMVDLITGLDPTRMPQNVPEFSFAPINVSRYRIKGADVFQTVYYPSPETNLYRVSITGDLLVVEWAGAPDDYYFWDSFGMHPSDCVSVDKANQRYGKIAPIDDVWRKNFIFDLSHNYKIFSLGRFGTWRNLLLDDVLKDISIVKKIMNTTSYERSKYNSK